MKTIFHRCIGGCAILCALGVSAVANESSPWKELEAFETHRVAQKSVDPMRLSAKEISLGNWYAGIHAGALIVPDTKFVGSGLDMDVDFGTGFSLGGSFGYAYNFGLRLDTDFTYQVSQANQLDIAGFLPSGSGNVETINLMLNGWFDIKFLSVLLGDWVPYFGGGAGITHAWIDVGTIGTPIVEAEDTVFAWQAGSGLAYKVSDGLFFTIDYRFFRTFGSFEFEDPLYAGPIKAKYKAHRMTVGFRGLF